MQYPLQASPEMFEADRLHIMWKESEAHNKNSSIVGVAKDIFPGMKIIKLYKQAKEYQAGYCHGKHHPFVTPEIYSSIYSLVAQVTDSPFIQVNISMSQGFPECIRQETCIEKSR